MAFIGLKHAVFAPIATETANSITYGQGMVIGKMIKAQVEFKRADGGLYADDALAESDNSIVSGTITMGLDDLSDEAQVMVLGVQANEVTGGTGGTGGTGSTGGTEYEDIGEGAPYGGVGYVRVRKKNGALSWVGYWVYKAQFGMASEEAQTKGESIEWQTPSIEGSIMGVVNDATGKVKFRKHRTFTTEADAIAWINGLANIA